MKSDGFPTYHLAHIVDDYLMQISHVTRANEWLNSLPLHVHIWKAFGWDMPEFAHLPVLLNPNGKGKISKRSSSFDQGGQKVLVLAKEFIDAGYLPSAMMNFMTNIGWNFGDDKEIFAIEEAIERFDLKDVNPANSAFPIEKLDWLNGQYIRELDVEALANLLTPYVEEADGLTANHELMLKVVPVAQTRIKTLVEFTGLAGFFFADWSVFESATSEMLIQKKMDAETTRTALEASVTRLDELETMEHSAVYESFKALAKEFGVKNGQLFGTLRVALTAQKISTPTFETMEILGKDESKRRIQLAIEALS